MSYILSFIVAFGVTFIAGQILVPLLRKWKAGQSIREDGPTWHMSKQGTPTMGGLMFILGIGADGPAEISPPAGGGGGVHRAAAQLRISDPESVHPLF